MARRHDADPLLLQAVSERLARLLAESPPVAEAEGTARRAAPVGGGSAPATSPAPASAPATAAPRAPAPPTTAPPVASHGGPAAVAAGASPEVLDVDEVPAPRRFTRVHVGVVSLLLLVGLLWAGWTLLRARPVALAAPVTVSSVAPPGSALPTAGGPSPSLSSLPSALDARSSGPPATTVVVHVLGAVRRPGLVVLPEPARVQDAVDAAGGLRADADPGELNLAQRLVDGQQVVIGTERKPDGEVRGSSGATTPGAASPGGGGPTGTGAAGAGTVELNTATPAELEELPGVGPVTAAAIVAWRTEHGRFSRPEELQEVDGIGPKTYAQIAPHVRV